MPLFFRERFKQGLIDDFKNAEKKLIELLNSEQNGIYNALKKIEIYTKENSPNPITDIDYDPEELKEKIKKNISKEWSESLGKQITAYMTNEMAEIITKNLFSVLVGIKEREDENEDED